MDRMHFGTQLGFLHKISDLFHVLKDFEKSKINLINFILRHPTCNNVSFKKKTPHQNA